MKRPQGELTQVEIDRVFEALNLTTQQQRDRFLPPLPLIPETPRLPDRLYVTHLSNTTQPVKTEADPRAELG